MGMPAHNEHCELNNNRGVGRRKGGRGQVINSTPNSVPEGLGATHCGLPFKYVLLINLAFKGNYNFTTPEIYFIPGVIYGRRLGVCHGNFCLMHLPRYLSPFLSRRSGRKIRMGSV